MLELDLSQMRRFVPSDYEAALAPRLHAMHETLQTAAPGGAMGWVHLPCRPDPDEYARLKAAAARIRSDSGALVVLGAGGSYLGARGVVECLRSPRYNLLKKSTPNLYFAGNGFCADELGEVLDLLEGVDFTVNLVSKSGSTTEPSVAFRLLRRYLETRYGPREARRRILVTTDPERGPLRAAARREGWESFSIPADVGGRYSVLTAAGLLPIAAAGVDTDAMLAGAARMAERCARDDLDNPAWQYAAARYQLYCAGKTVEILASFDPAFRLMAQWWKQLFGESEGKEGKGLYPDSAIYTADLHAIGQYVQQGRRLMLETTVLFGRSRRTLTVPEDPSAGDGLDYLAGKTLDEIRRQAARGTVLAHTDGGVPSLQIFLEERNAESLGELLYFFEYACALSGSLLGVNPFDQPGVEAYKNNLFTLLGRPGWGAGTPETGADAAGKIR